MHVFESKDPSTVLYPLSSSSPCFWETYASSYMTLTSTETTPQPWVSWSVRREFEWRGSEVVVVVTDDDGTIRLPTLHPGERYVPRLVPLVIRSPVSHWRRSKSVGWESEWRDPRIPVGTTSLYVSSRSYGTNVRMSVSITVTILSPTKSVGVCPSRSLYLSCVKPKETECSTEKPHDVVRMTRWQRETHLWPLTVIPQDPTPSCSRHRRS